MEPADSFYFYVLRSIKTGNFYTGSTDDPERRIAEHNLGTVKSTRARRPWELVYVEQFETRSLAESRERQVKSWKSATTIELLLKGTPDEEPWS